MTNQELQRLVERISLESFGRPFRHRAWFNPRLRTTGGRYQLTDHSIEINPRMLTEHDETTLEGIIKHELCHYHLHMAGQSGQHRTRAFRELLQQVGGLRFAPAPKQTRPKLRRWQLYVCQNCGQKYYRARRIDVTKMVCGRCRGHLVWQKTVIAVQRPR